MGKAQEAANEAFSLCSVGPGLGSHVPGIFDLNPVGHSGRETGEWTLTLNATDRLRRPLIIDVSPLIHIFAL